MTTSFPGTGPIRKSRGSALQPLVAVLALGAVATATLSAWPNGEDAAGTGQGFATTYIARDAGQDARALADRAIAEHTDAFPETPRS
jgi:hypothetical protein